VPFSDSTVMPQRSSVPIRAAPGSLHCPQLSQPRPGYHQAGARSSLKPQRLGRALVHRVFQVLPVGLSEFLSKQIHHAVMADLENVGPETRTDTVPRASSFINLHLHLLSLSVRDGSFRAAC
jgi:hypothetical protein